MTWQQPGTGDPEDPYRDQDGEPDDRCLYPPPPPAPGQAWPGSSPIQDTPRPGQPAYGAPAQGAPIYGQPVYGQPVYGQPLYGQPGTPYTNPPPGSAAGLPDGARYADYPSRVGAALLDGLVAGCLMVPVLVVFGVVDATTTPPPRNPDGTQDPSDAATATLLAGMLLVLCFAAWNAWRSGSRGQSLGKQWVGIHLVRDTTGRPPGGWTGLGRAALRSVLGGVSCGLYTLVTLLWPLWDARQQTLEDKMVNTLVLRLPDRRCPVPGDPAPASARVGPTHRRPVAARRAPGDARGARG